MEDIVSIVVIIVVFLSILLKTFIYCLHKSWGKVLHELCILPVLIFFLCYDVMGGVTGINKARLYNEAYEEGAYYLVDHGTFVEVNLNQYNWMLSLQIIAIIFTIIYVGGYIIPIIREKVTKE